jgi:uroporphyrinogen-III synthase
MMSPARLIEASGPLAGASVIVTRPSASAQALKARIRARGGTPIGLPGVVLRAQADAVAARATLRAVRASDIAIFTSPAAVKYAFALLPKLRFARATVVCCVGGATARALARHGARDALWPRQRQDSEGLLALPPLQKLRGKRIALIGAAGGRELLAQTLRTRRARVTHVHVYERTAPRYRTPQLVALEQAAAPLLTLLTSGEVLANLRAQLPLHLFARLAAGELIVSSQRLAALAQHSLFVNVHIAASPSPQDLLDTAQAALARHRL